MDNKLLLIFILLFLSFLLLFYYLKLKTNVIMLLSIIIVLCINKLIVQKEYFNERDDIIRKLINYMVNDNNDESPTPAQLPFLGSEQETNDNEVNSNNTASVPTKRWRQVLTEIRTKFSNNHVSDNTTISTLPFINSIKTPRTPTTK